MIKVTKETHLLNIQLAFQEQFGKLKLDFFKTAHDKKELTSITEELMEDYTVGQLNPDFEDKVFVFYLSEKVGDLEERIEKELGLHAQVLRRSGNIYLQTSVTDDWSLAKQMEAAI